VIEKETDEKTDIDVFKVIPRDIESMNLLEPEMCTEQPLDYPGKNNGLHEVFHGHGHEDHIGRNVNKDEKIEEVTFSIQDVADAIKDDEDSSGDPDLTMDNITQSNIPSNVVDKYSCNLCPRRFKNEPALATHFRLIHNSGYLKNCPFCDDKFNISETRETFYTHVTDLHDSERESDVFHKLRKELFNREPFNRICQLCGKIIRSRGNWNAHMQSKHSKSDLKTYKTCHICGKSMNSSAMASHLKTVHVFEPSSCSECGVSCKNKKYLIAHMRTHNTIPFPCETCGKHFRTKRSLSEHITCVHLKDNSYKCEHCGKGFPKKEKLKMHILCLHTSNEDKPFACEKCEYRCSRRDSIKNHIQNNHRK
jgi:hypothetical protein